jgi:hypothetical protein
MHAFVYVRITINKKTLWHDLGATEKTAGCRSCAKDKLINDSINAAPVGFYYYTDSSVSA